MSVRLSVCLLPIGLSNYQSIELSAYRSIILSAYRSTYRSIYRSADLSIDLPIYMTRCLSIHLLSSVYVAVCRSIELSVFVFAPPIYTHTETRGHIKRNKQTAHRPKPETGCIRMQRFPPSGPFLRVLRVGPHIRLRVLGLTERCSDFGSKATPLHDAQTCVELPS